MNLKRNLLIAVSAFWLTAGAANAQIVVKAGPPPKHGVEPVPPPTHPGWVWTPGYYRWNSLTYEWVPGSYRRPPHPGAIWIPGQWKAEAGGQIWYEGYWR